MAAAAAQLRVLRREGVPAGATLLAGAEDEGAPALRVLFAGLDAGAAEHEEELYARGRRCAAPRVVCADACAAGKALRVAVATLTCNAA